MFTASAHYAAAQVTFICAFSSYPMCCGRELRLGFTKALQISEERSARITAQEAVVGAVTEQAARARDLPGPKRRFGIDNLPVSHPDAFSRMPGVAPLSIQP